MSSDTEKFYTIVAELDRRLTPGTGDGFWSVRPLFTEMDRSFLNGWSACRLQELLDDKEVLVFRDRNALTINITKGYAISLALIDTPSDALFLYPQHYMARNVGTVPLKVAGRWGWPGWFRVSWPRRGRVRCRRTARSGR